MWFISKKLQTVTTFAFHEKGPLKKIAFYKITLSPTLLHDNYIFAFLLSFISKYFDESGPACLSSIVPKMSHSFAVGEFVFKKKG